MTLHIRPTLFSFFSGAGFLDLGFEDAGFQIALVNEIHRPFLHAYQHSRAVLGLPEPEFGYFEGDINLFFERKHGQYLAHMIALARRRSGLVGFIGGPPCPDFSVGGKNRGRKGENGRLSASYVELIIQQKPDFFIFENVKGLWSTRRHRAFYEELKFKLHNAGYVTTERLVNAIEYGVPQDRERIILLGFSQETAGSLLSYLIGPEIPEDYYPWDESKCYSQDEVFGLPWVSTSPFLPDVDIPCPPGTPEELTVEFWFRKNDVYNHPNSHHHFVPRSGISKMEMIDEGDVSKKSYKRLHRWRYSPTAAYGNNEVHLHPYKVRRLSVAETLAIQSLPRAFELPEDMTLTDMFKTVGNGVPYLLARGIAEALLRFLGGLGYGEVDSREYCS